MEHTHNLINFYGVKQVTEDFYKNLSDEEKVGYLWLVRRIKDNTVVWAGIYFGTRLYGETDNIPENNKDVFVNGDDFV